MASFHLFQRGKDKVPTRDLISEDLVGLSKAIAGDQSLNIWFCDQSGRQQVLGGIYGSQKIKATKILNQTSRKIINSLQYINRYTDLSIKRIRNKNKADIHIYLDKKIDMGAGAQYVGLTVHNEREAKWEIFISQKEIINENHKIYAILHEIGHALGLEHPHDQQDHDYYSSTIVKHSAMPHQTVMSYHKPLYDGIYPNQYTVNDLKALETIWGTPAKLGRSKIDQITRKPIRPKILGRQRLKLPIQTSNDIIIDGRGAPNANLKVFFKNKLYQTLTSNNDGKWSLVFNQQFLNSQTLSLATHLKIEQLDEFGNFVESIPYYIDLI